MFHDLAIALEYEALFTVYRDAMAKGVPTVTPLDREAFYWECIARPFARSHGFKC